MILKYRELVANIKASNVDIGDTGIKFYTEDDGTAAIGIAIKHNKTPYDLTANKMTPQLHLFLQDGSIILNEPLKIISGEKGLIEYQVTEKVIKHVGKAFAKLILQGEPNDQGISESVHALNFRFEILNSGIEEAIEKVIDVKLLSEIFEDFALSHPEFMTGLQRNVYTIREGYWYLDGVNTNILADVSKFKHTHPISEVTDLQNILDGKASQSHVLDAASHVSPTDRKMWDSKISQTSADARYVQQTNAFTQAQADGIYLKKTDQLNLGEYTKTTDADNKYALKSHVHSTSEISDFSVEMAKKADKVHNHDGVYSKAGDSYTKVESDGKYATKSHTHQISDVTNLQSSLDAKASKAEVTAGDELTKLYVQSRGENLVTNGTGLLGTNTNFTATTFKQDEVKVGGGSFYTNSTTVNASGNSFTSDEYIPVDTSKTYQLSVWSKTKNNASTNNFIGIACYDIDKLAIDPSHYAKEGAGIVRLTQPLKKGDTKIYVDDISPWLDPAFAWQTNSQYKGLVVWGYKNSKGYTYPEGTYSRLQQQGIASIDSVNKIITLSAPFSHDNPNATDKIFPIGHGLSRSKNGSSYNYILASAKIPSTWTKYNGIFSGETDLIVDSNFRMGSAYIRPIFIQNRNAIEETWISGLEFKEVDPNNYALAGHNHDLTYIKKTDGQTYKTFLDTGEALAVATVDFNNPEATLTNSGFYFNSAGTNQPSGEATMGFINYYKRNTQSFIEYKPYTSNNIYLKSKTNGTWGSWTKLNGADLTNYYTKSETYSKTEIDAKIATGGSGGTTDLSAYSTTAQADAKYAVKTHSHAIADVTNLQSTLDGKAPISHTHTIANITNLQSTLDGKLTKTVADGLYAPIGSGSGGTVVVGGNVINANKRWGFVGDGTTDNYQAFKDMLTFVNSAAGQGAEIEWDGTYNGQQAQYRVDRYVTISNIDAAYASGSPTHMIWNAKNIKLKTNGAKFINMPMNGFTKTKAFTAGDGSWHYAKEEPITLFNFENCDGVIADSIFVDGENHKIKYAIGFTSKENDNPRWTDNKPLAEGRGHGVVFAGSKNVHIENIKSINQAVDGVAIAFSADYGTMVVNQTTSFNIINLVATGNGRLGVSGLGCHGGEITNLVAEYNGTNKNADGHYIYFSPAGGIDVEPHHSPIAMDNNSPTSYKVEDWNGSMAIKNARIRYNSGTQIACTSTLLTRSVIFERCVVRPPKNRTGDHQLIQSSLQNCRFIDMDVDGKLSDGALSRVMFYGAGYVSESTGVITGQAANVWSEIKGGKWANIEPWVNTDGNTTYNEIPTGQYGLHNIVFADLVMENVRFTLRTIRRFVFRNVVMNYPSDSAITKLYMWNANMKDVVMLNRKSSNITLDLGAGDSQSNFENLRITTGRFDWVSGTKKYKTATIGSESLDVYDYTRAMEYMLTNGATGGTPSTPPSDTTPPNAPTVNTVYTNSTTITGTAEANSTITLTGGFSGTTTANSSGSWSIIASNLTAGQTITVKAKDSAGNISTGTTVTIQAVPSSDIIAPKIIIAAPQGEYMYVWADEAGTVIMTYPDGTKTEAPTSYNGTDHVRDITYKSGAPSGTYKLQIKDAAGNLSNIVTFTNVVPNVTAKDGYTITGNMTIDVSDGGTTPPTTENLWPATSFNFTNKTIPQLGGSGSKYAMNSVYTISNNEAQPLNMTGSGDTVTINATASTSKYGFFTLSPNTQYTLRIKASDTIANASDLVTMLGGDYIWPNPNVKDITFTTDSNGKWGYDFNGVTYGNADATKGLFHRANGGKNSTTTYKIWLNKGATSTATWS